MKLKPGKIFLSDQRHLSESSTFRRYSTFNFEKFNDDNKQPFENLFLCNDESIISGKLTFFLSKEDSFQIFIPITGGIDIVSNGKDFSVDTGQVQVLNLGKGEVLEISNPYPNDLVNYIQLGIKTDLFLMRESEMLYNFNFEKEQNQLIEIISNSKLPFNLSAGIFAGRKEIIYKMRNPNSKFFTLIIDGAFEIEGRLLHPRDALALWDLENIEMEALSENAIALTIELLPGF